MPNEPRRQVVVDPFSGDEIACIPQTEPSELTDVLDRAGSYLKRRNRPTRGQRADILLKAAQLVEDHHDELSSLITRDSGKVIRQSRKEVARAVSVFKLAAAAALNLHGEEIPVDSFAGNAGFEGSYSLEPIGLVAGITPFNDPLNLAAHKMAPAIAAGAPIVLKPSELAPLCAIRLREILLEAGMAEAACQIVLGGADIGAALTQADPVRLISFTGGEETAARIMRNAGLKSFSFDLGGNAPVIVTSSADIKKAVGSCVSGAFWANGHNCISVQRILVDDSCFDEFTAKLVARTQELLAGDPSMEATDIGPMISPALADRVEALIASAAASSTGAVRYGGERNCNVISPAVIVEPSKNSVIASEELFGPAVAVFRYHRIHEAIELANAPRAALNAGIFSQSIDEALALCDALEFGAVIINESSDFRSDCMPFGGYKRGGVGREGVPFAIKEMTQAKARILLRDSTAEIGIGQEA